MSEKTNQPIYPPPPQQQYYGGQPSAPPPYNQQQPSYGQQGQYMGQQYGQPGYAPEPQQVVYTQQPQQTVVINTGGMMMGGPIRLGPMPNVTTCINCKCQITTQIHYENGCFVWLIAGVIFFFGFWLGCCLIPFCMNSCKDVVHVCPNCKTVQGRYSRM